ncbi:MAG: zinc ribbon domain-containing protein [Caldicoprobacterales bacterium]|nr:zinc ribbon domain-containing protein [Clostridiales bacterium]
MAKKEKSNKIPLPILIIVCAVLLYAAYTSISTLVLAIFGDSVIGTVDSYGSQLIASKAEPNRSRIVSKGYWFMANGREYRGYVMYNSDEAWPSLKEGETRSERIRYLPVFPYINKPAMLSNFDEMGEGGIIYHFFAPIGCLFLLRLVIRTARGKKTNKTASRKPAAKSAIHGETQTIKARSDMDMFCPNCGNRLTEGADFCTNCGAKIQAGTPNVCTACGAELPEGTAFCIGCGKAVGQAAPGPAAAGQAPTYIPSQAAACAPSQGSAGLVGFSDRCHSPEILAAAEKNRKYAIGFMWVLVFVPLIGFPVAGLLIDEMPLGESVIIGLVLSLVMLVMNLLRLRSAKQPMWEGVVVNKYSKIEYKHRDQSESYTVYTTVIHTDTGKKKTINERDSRRHMYDYLSVGDRVRYHPRFGTYEKYDKSKDSIIYCNVCTTMNPIQNDRCKRCNNLLFK